VDLVPPEQRRQRDPQRRPSSSWPPRAGRWRKRSRPKGTIATAQTDDLNFTAASTVTAVNVKAGQTVNTGDVLATIDSAALQSAVAGAESTVAQAAAKLSDDKRARLRLARGGPIAGLTSAQDQLASAQTALAGASARRDVRRHGRGGEHHHG
jgi:multidrug efflux pump subunit AcrA (membrane-fusion protein)